MTREQIEHMKRYTEQHVLDPQMGDHFTDHMSSVAYVESRHDQCVRVAKPCHEAKVFHKAAPMTLEAFREWLSPKGRTWVELWPPAAPKQLLEGG